MKRICILILFLSIISPYIPVRADGLDNYGDPQRLFIIRSTATREHSESDGDNPQNSHISLTYYDGLGKELQCIRIGASPSGSDMASMVEYDSRDRIYKRYLGMPISGNKATGAFVSPDDYTSAVSQLYPDDAAYSYTKQTYDRTVESWVSGINKPGESWKDISSDKYYFGISADDNLPFCVLNNATGQLTKKSAAYGNGMLRGEITTDEDGYSVCNVYDFENRLIRCYRGHNLSKESLGNLSSDSVSVTDYIYDIWGNLRYVFPPMASKAIALLSDGTSIKDSDSFITDYSWRYIYDFRNRLVELSKPGIDSEEYVYDSFDRLRYFRDGNMRLNGVWMAYAYDAGGREAYRGPVADISSREQLQSAMRHNRQVTKILSTGGEIYGYTNIINGLALDSVQAVTYYDRYDFTDIPGIMPDSLGYVQRSDFPAKYVSQMSFDFDSRGLVTGRAVQAVGRMMWTTFYYDKWGNLIQKHQNNIADGYDHFYYEVAQDGSVLRENHKHSASGVIGKTVNHDDYHVYKYDDAGRLYSEVLGHDGAGYTLYYIAFDELGRPKFNGRNGDNVVISSYSYDIHGNMLSHNNEFFSQRLYYDKAPDGSSGLLGGRINAMDWTDFNGHTRRYSYAYDKLDRLVSAEYSEPDGRNLPGVDAAVNTPDYSCRYTYDLNGNMTSVTRKGVTSRIRDGHNYKLIFGTAYSGGFTYSGNQRLSDTQLMPVATFDPLSSMTMQTSIRPGGGSLLIPTRRYDANGNLTSDPSRCIDEITYDINNQPRSIVFTPEQAGMNPTYRSYMYDADGNRLSAGTVGAKGRTLRLYCGRYQYDVAMTFPLRSYETFYTSNGYLQNGFMRYYVTDYLGNVRAVVSEDGTVEQSSHYYPYGALMDESLGEDTQPYLFGGKELENMMSLGQYDFGARSYTAVAPAFCRPDPHAANTPQLSPYIYCASNPVAYRDPDGCEIRGVTKKDAEMAVEDFRAMFPGDEFALFRNLIVQSGKKQNGKSFASISADALSSAFSGIMLNEDQQALINMVVNTINSEDVHKVEYIEGTGNLSYSAEKVFAPLFDYPALPTATILNANGGFPVAFIKNQGGGGLTTSVKNGTYSLIFKDSSFHLNGRAVTTGHEIIGHGRSLAVGRGDSNQHVDAIQTENLILRVMGIPYINTGEKHAPNGAFPGCSLLPSFR